MSEYTVILAIQDGDWDSVTCNHSVVYVHAQNREEAIGCAITEADDRAPEGGGEEWRCNAVAVFQGHQNDLMAKEASKK